MPYYGHQAETPQHLNTMTSTAFNDDIRALLDCPLYELNDRSLSKLRLFLLGKNQDIQAEMNKRQEIISRAQS